MSSCRHSLRNAAPVAIHYRSIPIPLLVAALLALPVAIAQAQDNAQVSTQVEHATPRPMPQFTNTPKAPEESVGQEMRPIANTSGGVTEDFNDSTPTAWWVYTGQTPAEVSNLLSTLGARIVDISVDSITPTFTVTLVQNSGAYAKAWWWYYGVTAAQVGSALSTNKARPISLKAYDIGSGQIRFAVVMIANTGADAEPYWWYFGQTGAEVGTLLSDNKARLLTLDSYLDGTSTYYTAVMVPNSNNEAWWYYYDVSPSTIGNSITTNKSRLFYMSSAGGGNFNAILEGCSGGCAEWWWYYGESAGGLINTALQNGARMVDVTTYPGCGGTCYAGPMINNSNAITTRVGNILRGGGVGGRQGLYLKRVDGPVLANLEDGFVYEPASAIKVVNNLYAMFQMQLGNVDENTAIPHYTNGPDSCPDPPTVSGTEPLDLALREMMWHSDNARTAEIDDYFGFANVNAFADIIGMKHTKFNGYVGCGTPPNTFTLDDAGLLYEDVADQTILDATYRGNFYSTMAGRAQYEAEGYDWTAVWDTDIPNIINEVAPAGTTAAQKTAYMNAMNVAYKAGSYLLCPTSGPVEDLDIAGWFQVPVCTTGGATYAEYTWGIFFANAPRATCTTATNSTADNNFTAAKSELMREQIQAGMASCNGKSLDVLTYSPADLVFASQKVGTTSASKAITITNKETTTITGLTVSVYGEFTETNNCPSSLAAGGSCTVTVWFQPAGTAERTGAVVVSDDGTGEPQTIELTGTGS
ncbi:MAG TPA: choice-of-anchor D domain-containing protein [Terracidiphilus sp.]|nr:choice-of-anchor D domain-containing protein [Terracidiphilus sp.]